jgi:hypothetical protein
MEDVGAAGELEEDERQRQRFEEEKDGPAH